MKIAYRGWNIRQPEGKYKNLIHCPVLISPFRDTVWPIEGLSAECTGAPSKAEIEDYKGGDSLMLGHMASCNCGIYSLKTPEEAILQSSADIIGEVIIYGDIIEGEKGFRSTKGRIGTLFLPDELEEPSVLFEALSRYYDVPIIKGPGYSSKFLRPPFILDDQFLGNIQSIDTTCEPEPNFARMNVNMIFPSDTYPRLRPDENIKIDLTLKGLHLQGEAILIGYQATREMSGWVRLTLEMILPQCTMINNNPKPFKPTPLKFKPFYGGIVTDVSS